MTKTITMTFNTDGSQVNIDMDGFTGDLCAKETQKLEEALGKVTKRNEKPEMRKKVAVGEKVKVGG